MGKDHEYVCLFLVAPLCAFLNNIVEIRIDAHKFVCDVRRPVAKKVADIGKNERTIDRSKKKRFYFRNLEVDYWSNIKISNTNECKLIE